MAACLITVGGTSGGVNIRYTDSGKFCSINADFGSSVYIPDTATGITFTTLSGDATASSLCVTITELPSKCYIFDWETFGLTDTASLLYYFDKIILGSEEISFTNAGFNDQHYDNLAVSINNIGDDRIKFVAGKRVDSGRNSWNFYVIIRVLSTYTPELRVNNTSETHLFYLKGTYTADCLPSGYTEYTDCLAGYIPPAAP